MRPEIGLLTGLRGIAAYSVLIAHGLDVSFSYSGTLSVFHPLASRLAYFGMTLFFVLSGFVIFYNYADSFAERPFRYALWDFVAARFARLYPLYALSLLMTMSYLPSPFFAHDAGTVIAYATLTQSWFNLQDAMFSPDWSISTEWFFYLVFVLIVLPVRILTRRAARIVFITLLLVAPVVIAVIFSEDKSLVQTFKPIFFHGDKVSTDLWFWLTYFNPYLRALEFVAGMLSAKVMLELHRTPLTPHVGSIILACCVGACAIVLLIPAISDHGHVALVLPNFLFAPAISIFICYCPRQEGVMKRLLESRPLMFMGEISYSVYIWCWFAITLMAPQFVSPSESPLAYLNSFIKLILIVGITTVFAIGSYRAVEVPCRNWLRSKLGQKPAGPTRESRGQAAAVA